MLRHRMSRTWVQCRRHAPAVQLASTVFLGQILAWFASEAWLGVITLTIGLLVLVCRKRTAIGLCCGVLLGIISTAPAIRHSIFSQNQRAAVAPEDDAIILGNVIGNPRRPRPGEVIFEVKTATEPVENIFRCRAIDLPWRNAVELKDGDLIWVRGAMTPVVRDLNPFSWAGSLWRRGIDGELKARFVSRAVVSNESVPSAMRQYVHQRVLQDVDSSQGTALFLSIALGYHDLLSVPLERAFMRLGLTHLLVVSGYQVSLMFSFILATFSLVAAHLKFGGRLARKILIFTAFSFATLYVCFIGAEMSSVRALIAAACICAHLVSERNTSYAQRWGVALLAMQLIWPWCIFDLGVILTFAALIGIGIGSSLGAGARFKSLCWVTLSVWIMTSFVIMVWRGTISPLGLIFNLIFAAPWSVINCSVGLLALVGLMLGIPGLNYVIKLLSLINNALGEGVLMVSELPYVSVELEGIQWILGSIVMVSMTIALLVSYAINRRKTVWEV